MPDQPPPLLLQAAKGKKRAASAKKKPSDAEYDTSEAALGAFDVSTMGSVANVGLMAQKARH